MAPTLRAYWQPRRRAAPLAVVLATLLLAAWAVPPLLDWGRFRTQIAAIAAARLGRPVTISGDITLRLLPQAVLTATDVTLPDQGDGISIQVNALRLQVATLPLLAGHLRLRDLVLSAPTLHLPLIVAHPSRPQIPHPFAARIEAGTLRIGQAEITGITATIHGGPALASTTTSMPEALAPGGIPVAAFGAEGFASAAGRIWRFTGALGAPDADGVSAVDISVRGQGTAANTGGSIQATLADGILQGRLRAGGPDLSQLIPAAAQAWTADTPFTASTDRIEANAIRLSLGGSPADGGLILQLDAPARLEGQLHAATLDLDGWAALLGRTFAAGAPTEALPLMSVALEAGQARLLGGKLHDLRATFTSDGRQLGFDHAHALLPGNASLDATQARLASTNAAGEPAPLSISSDMQLTAPDLRATLAWLRPLAPGFIGALPAGVLAKADLSGHIALSHAGLAATTLAGHIDGAAVAGSLALQPSQRPVLTAALNLSELDLTPWMAAWPGAVPLQTAGRAFTGMESAVRLAVGHAHWRAITLDQLTVDATAGAVGLRLGAAGADLDGAHLTATGTLAPDGSLTAAGATLRTQDAARLRRHLPAFAAAWPGVWQGPASAAVEADGPPAALNVQLRADIADAVLEAEGTRDTLAGTGSATLTLRHPGAPRLLAALGLAASAQDAAGWLDTGSLTLRAHLTAAPGRLTAQDFELNAAALRFSGQVQADWSTPFPQLTGTLHAEQLALPDSLPPPASLPAGWASQLHISADSVTLGGRKLTGAMQTDLATAGPDILADKLTATVAGGRFAGRIAADLGTPTMAIAGTLAGATIGGPLTGWPLDLDAGQADLSADLWLPGLALGRMSGSAHASLAGGRLAGASLALLPHTIPHTRAGRAQLQKALGQGNSPNLAGAIDATATAGQITLGPSRLTSPDGTVSMAGHVDLAAGSADWRLMLGNIPVRLSGPLHTMRAHY